MTATRTLVAALGLSTALGISCYSEQLEPPTYRYPCDSDADCTSEEVCRRGLCERPCNDLEVLLALAVESDDPPCPFEDGYAGCYNGACAASLAARVSEGEEREAFLKDAWTWLADDLNRTIVEPLRSAQGLFVDYPYLTRLYTTLSAEDRGGATFFVNNGEIFTGPLENFSLPGIKDFAGNPLEANRKRVHELQNGSLSLAMIPKNPRPGIS